MLISLIFLLISNAVTLRRDKSILFSRVVIKSLPFASFIYFNNNLFTPFIGFSAKTVGFNPSSITINSALSSTIYIFTFLLILFICTAGEWFNVVSILTLISIKA